VRFTIRDVAERAAVSPATVSRVLNGHPNYVREDTRARVLQVVKELGYQPHAAASALRTNRTYAVGLIIPDITNPIWPEVALGVQRTARRAGYSVVLANTDGDDRSEHDYLAMARRAGLDGLVINPSQITSAELLDTGIPATILGNRTDFPAFDTVGVDSEGGTVAAVEHLYGLGHRRIALVVSPNNPVAGRTRRRGYQRALAACDLPLDDRYVVEPSVTHDGTKEALTGLMGLAHPPTAIFASNDHQAIALLAAARLLGIRVPEHLSIVGMDDIAAAAATVPPLTTLRRPQRAYGEAAMEFLLERLEGRCDAPPRRLLYSCELIVRGSTAPPA
jgi:DNA-binding LacI/PurR family transcriptional regulator